MIKKYKQHKIPRNLGILSICIGTFFTIAGIILGIIGLSIPQDKQNHKRDMTLNIIGISWSILKWGIYALIMLT